MGAGVPAADAGAGGSAVRRDGPSQDPRLGLDRSAAAPAPRPAGARAAPGLDRRHAQPRRDRGPGGAGVPARTTRAFAAKNLAAAKTAWAAAKANPAIYADPADGVGGGAYNDADVSDEFYWAAAELFITTGGREYRDFLLASPHHTGDIWRERGFDWGNTAAARPARARHAAQPAAGPRAGCGSPSSPAPTRYLATLKAHPYGIPYAPAENTYDWGSNNLILNNAVVMAMAFDITGQRQVPRRRAGDDGLHLRPQRPQPVLCDRLRRGGVEEPAQPVVRPAAQPRPAEPAAGHPVRRPELVDPGPGRAAEAAGAAPRSSATSTTSSRGRRTS